jgi:DNA-binding XRE family transcriptional regulator
MARPRKVIDESLLRKLAVIHCTQDEMASVLGVSTDTLQRRFAAQIKSGRDEGKMSLRRKMWEMALNGNVSLLIWLSKNELGMTDKVEEKREVQATVQQIEYVAKWGNSAAPIEAKEEG